MNRRNFIKNVSCGAMGTTTLLSSLTSLGALNGIVNTNQNQSGEDYKALVCILLAGGIDYFNMLIPTGNGLNGDNGFSEYNALRTDLKIVPTASKPILQLNNLHNHSFRGKVSPYASFGVHPEMVGIRDLFNTGKASLMANIGTLVEPIANKTEFNAPRRNCPVEYTPILTKLCNGKLQCHKVGRH